MCGGGILNGIPAPWILRLARTSRCAIVASETRNARAISPVESPPSERRISATCASSPSAGWAHVKISSRRSSGNCSSTSGSSSKGAGGQGALPADPVDRAVARRHDQPGGGIRRLALARPALGGDRERLLGGLLGEIDVAEVADQRGEHPAPLLAEQLLDQRATSGRTSTAPPSRAAGMRAASSIAASRSSASNR